MGLFLSLLHRFTVRYWTQHWIKLGLLVSIVGLGTGAFLAIGLANRAATQSFDRFAQTVSGQSQVVLTSSLGDLSLADLKSIRKALLDSEAAIVPQIVTNAQLADRPDIKEEERAFSVIGMDLLAASNFLIRHKVSETFLKSSDDPETPLVAQSGLYAQAETAAAYGWKKGDRIPLFLGDQLLELPWAGELPTIDANSSAPANVLVMDWRELSDLLDKPLHASRVDFVWVGEYDSDQEIAKAVASLKEANPGNWIIESQAQRQKTGATMTLALRMNLRALSALSLLVAVFLVFQAMDSTIARRQSEVATLHSLGVSKNTTRIIWFSDSILVGILGGGLGLAMGFGMATVSTKLVTQTVNTLYFKAGTPPLEYATSEALLAWGLTVGFCVVAGWWPARQAAKSPLIETIREGSHRSTYSRRTYLVAFGVFALLSILAYQIPPIRAENGHATPVGGYLLAIALIGLLASLACLCLELLGKLTHFFSKFSSSATLALSQFRKPVTRHRLALAGVALSVGMTASMIFLIGSFESTVRSWIGNTLQADLFIRPKAVNTSHDSPTISLATIDAFRDDPRISDIGTIHATGTRIQDLATTLVGFDTQYLSRIDHTTWIQRPENLLELQNGATTIVNEAFSNRFQKSVGDTVLIPNQPNPLPLEVIGVYADYGNENGSLGIDKELFTTLTQNLRPRAVALHVDSKSDLDRVAKELTENYPGLQVMTNRWLRQESLRIFKRVFSITYALEAIGLIISIAGLGSMLASLLIERRSETSTLIRIGFSPRQIATTTASEGIALSALAITTGLLLGVLLGLVLVFIINRQSFGWTLAVDMPWSLLCLLGVLTLGGAGVVSYLVGKWSSKQPLVTEE